MGLVLSTIEFIDFLDNENCELSEEIYEKNSSTVNKGGLCMEIASRCKGVTGDNYSKKFGRFEEKIRARNEFNNK